MGEKSVECYAFHLGKSLNVLPEFSIFLPVSVKFHILHIVRHPSENTKLSVITSFLFLEQELLCPLCAIVIVRCGLLLAYIGSSLPPRKAVRCSAGLRVSSPIANLLRILWVHDTCAWLNNVGCFTFEYHWVFLLVGTKHWLHFSLKGSQKQL
jgi:hypothetical protein